MSQFYFVKSGIYLKQNGELGSYKNIQATNLYTIWNPFMVINHLKSIINDAFSKIQATIQE
jgi:hypothetical protein